MKKLIFGLMAFMLLFFVVSCDDGSKANSSSLGTNPYENLEKSLTVKLNSIDEVEFSDGEWEFYIVEYESERCFGSETWEEKGIITVDNGIVTEKYEYSRSKIECLNEEDYLYYKEKYADRKGYTYDDKNKVICFSNSIPEGEVLNYDVFVSYFDWCFSEDFKEETEEYCETATYLAKTNSKKEAFLFFEEGKYEDYIESEESGMFSEKYIFKKIK